MNRYIKLISDDMQASAVIRTVAESNQYILQSENDLIPGDSGEQALIIIADRQSPYYKSLTEHAWSGVSHSLVILADRNDNEISAEIKRLRPSGVIYKPVDAVYAYAVIETAYSGMIEKEETFSLGSLIRAAEEMPGIIFVADKNRNLIYTNRMFQNLTGYSTAETELMLMENSIILPCVKNILKKVISSSGQWRGEITEKNKKGDEFTILSSISPLKNSSGEIIGYVAVSEDISQRKEIELNLEKAKKFSEEASEAKTRFIANISHEIRTPMNAIIGMTDLALLTNDSEEILDYLIDLKSATGRLLDLTDNILNFSKIETGEMRLEMSVFNLSQVIDSSINKFRGYAQEKGIILGSSLMSYVDNSFSGDSSAIGQVLDHLISNAVKFTETGLIHLEVLVAGETFVHREKRTLVQFILTDTGIGIPPDKIDIIFEKFIQAENSRTKCWGGAGLGLSISKKLVELMNGNLEVESTVGSGSRFSFTIPLKAEITAPDAERKIILSGSVPEKILRILVVDDNPVNTRLAEIVLKKLGHIVETAINGRVAIERLSEGCFDVIFMDIEMPVMDGMETTRLIRAGEAGKNKKSIPIVAMTAYAIEEYEYECLKIGMNYFLTKPINVTLIPELLNCINTDCSPG